MTVAKTALWIAESQMMKETEIILHMQLDFLPLKSYANIVEGNALRMDWESVIPKGELNYIMGNPPFVGLYHFGILTSNVHMAWVRAVCGRLKSDYRYSRDIVYNNFPWPDVTHDQKAVI